MDNTAQIATWRQIAPYGGPRGSAPNAWPDQNGFLNKPTDSVTGLTDVGARAYDPSTGRFISADPILDPSNPQSMTGYSYAGDDPVNDSDPTGLCAADDGPGGKPICAPACELSGKCSGPPDVPNATLTVSSGGGSVAPAPKASPPAVSNSALSRILGDVYIKPSAAKWIGDGTVWDALNYETSTGQQTGGTWHFKDAADLLNRLASWLEDVRKGKITALDSDIKIARDTTAKIWGAMNSGDTAGNETSYISKLKSEDSVVYDQYRGTLKNALSKSAISDIVGTTFVPRPFKSPMIEDGPDIAAAGVTILNILDFSVEAGELGVNGAMIAMLPPNIQEAIDRADSSPLVDADGNEHA